MDRLSVVVPLYNEEMNLKLFIPELIDLCKKNNFNVIFVNDGSIDNTGIILEEYNKYSFVEIITHKINKGYGAALKSGISKSDSKYTITIDGDGQHYTEDILKLLEIISLNDNDIVIGCRLNEKLSIKKIGKKIIKLFTKLIFKHSIYDLNSGMKIYKTELVKNYLKYCPDNMPFSDIITLIFLYKKHSISEAKIEIKKRKSGKSKISVNTAFETIFEIINIATFFYPLRIFIPLSFKILFLSLIWSSQFIIKGEGLSTGSLLGILVALLIFLLGLISEQISQIRKKDL